MFKQQQFYLQKPDLKIFEHWTLEIDNYYYLCTLN